MNHCTTDDQLSDFDANALEACKNMSTDEAYRKVVAACSTTPQSATESFLEKAKAAHDRMSKERAFKNLCQPRGRSKICVSQITRF